MTGVARLTEVADQVAAALGRPTDPAAAITVTREYAPDWLDPEFWKDNANLATSFTGRRVYVFGTGEVHGGPLTRAEDQNQYQVVVVVFELYTDDGPVAKAWVDDRVAWVEKEVYDRLGTARLGTYPGNPLIEDFGAEAVTQEWTTVVARDLLRQLGLFRSEVVFNFRRTEDIRSQ